MSNEDLSFLDGDDSSFNISVPPEEEMKNSGFMESKNLGQPPDRRQTSGFGLSSSELKSSKLSSSRSSLSRITSNAQLEN